MSLFFSFRKKKSLYTKLQGGAPRFRLLRLDPGLWAQPLICTLRELPLDEAPPYGALSYAWNDCTRATSDKPISIECNGFSVPVSPNLDAALRRLRQISDFVHVWVDAICINQKDDRERTNQVQIMRAIYEKSEEVSIWLGEGTEHDDMGDDVMVLREPTGIPRPYLDWKGDSSDKPLWDCFLQRQKARQGTISMETRDVFGAFCVLWLLSVGVNASENMHLRHIAQSTTILNGLDAIRERPWWRRVWVVQETVVASNAVVYYGKLSAPWKMMADAAAKYHAERLTTGIESVYPYLRPLTHFSRIVRDIEGVRLTWRHQYKLVPFLPLLHQFRSRCATDPRDKVYALLGIVQQWEGPERVIPDYTLDVREVFWKATITFIKNFKSLDALAGTPTQRTASESTPPGPSWVTDWGYSPENHEKTRIFGSLPLYNASKSFYARAVRTHGRALLEVSGVCFDKVSDISAEVLPPQVAEEGSTAGWCKVIADWELLLQKQYSEKSAYAGGGTIEDAFWRTLCGDCEHIRSEAFTGLRRAESTLQYGYDRWRTADTKRRRMTSIVGGYWQESGAAEGGFTKGDVQTERKNAFHYALEYAASGRRLFVTEMGYLGLGPPDMVPGDCVYIVAGSRVPFLLRPGPRTGCNKAETETLMISGTDRTFITAGSRAKVLENSQAELERCSEKHEDCFFLVGDVYLHGIMDGQVGSTRDSRGYFRKSKPLFLV